MGKLYVVYNECIKDPKTGKMPYKIGITEKTVKERYYGLGLKMPGIFKCDFVYEFDDKKLHAKLEKTIHSLLEPQRVNGEWFNCSEKMLNSIRKICKDFNGKLIVEDKILNEKEKGNDSIFLLAQKRIETMLSILTKKHNLKFQKKTSDKLNVIRIENKFGAKLECNIYHAYNKRVDLEFICRSSHKFPEIKTFIKELNGEKINKHEFKVSENASKLYHIFDYDDPTIMETFLELLNFVSEKMKSSKIFEP